jgi:hypothetical protein
MTEKNSAFTELDFFKKNETVQKINKIEAPVGFWGFLTMAIGLFGLFKNVEYAGWVLFIGFLIFGKSKGWRVFALCLLGLIGLNYQVPYSGWLIFVAFFINEKGE